MANFSTAMTPSFRTFVHFAAQPRFVRTPTTSSRAEQLTFSGNNTKKASSFTVLALVAFCLLKISCNNKAKYNGSHHDENPSVVSKTISPSQESTVFDPPTNTGVSGQSDAIDITEQRIQELNQSGFITLPIVDVNKIGRKGERKVITFLPDALKNKDLTLENATLLEQVNLPDIASDWTIKKLGNGDIRITRSSSSLTPAITIKSPHYDLVITAGPYKHSVFYNR